MLRMLTAGESHGPALTVTVDGLPAGVPVDRAAIDADLRRRQGGYGRGGRMKIESDSVEVLGGIRHGLTLGSPVSLLIRNRDHQNWADVMSPDPQPDEARQRRALKRPRPGHADLAGALKFLTDDLRNVLERASARETTSRVAAGGLARSLLGATGIEVRSHVVRIGEAAVPAGAPVAWEKLAAIEDSPVRCADADAGAAMIAEIDRAKKAGDTVGGVFEVVVRGLPPGLGSFSQWDRRLDGRLAQALMSIPAVKAVALGAGFEGGETLFRAAPVRFAPKDHVARMRNDHPAGDVPPPRRQPLPKPASGAGQGLQPVKQRRHCGEPPRAVLPPQCAVKKHLLTGVEGACRGRHENNHP